MILALAMAAASPVIAVSCDGTLIVAAAPAPQVWQRGETGWEQLHGAVAPPPPVDGPGVQRASCVPAPISNTPMRRTGTRRIGGSSRDRSLLWSHEVDAASWNFVARLWTGERYHLAIDTTGPA